ncbi:MAG: ATP-binding cassette domain-containing protein [Rickettsiales bacterium]|nr:ATP-binding cassette domain-containing protein [Rickettsiales bacterium]
MDKKLDNILTVKNLSLKSVDNKRHILQDVEFDVKLGDFIIILGANGSGKSSLIKVVNKTYRSFTGEINFGFEEHNIKKISNKKYSEYVATITQDINANLFLKLSVLENCILYASKCRKASFFLKELNARNEYKNYLKKYNIKLASKLDTQVIQLSGGEKQSLILALTFLYMPVVLLLDEHTSALDPIAGEKLMQFTADKVREEKATCIMATHRLDHALKYGNKIIALKDGKIILYAGQDKKSKLSKEDLAKLYY